MTTIIEETPLDRWEDEGGLVSDNPIPESAEPLAENS